MNTIVVRKERIDASNDSEDPPTYSPPPQLPTGRAPLPLTTKPCNSVSVTRLEGDITGAFVIDPTLSILAALFLFNNTGDDNLLLKASWGRADVDIYLVAGGRGRVTKGRTKLKVIGQNDVAVRLVSVIGEFCCAQFLLNAISVRSSGYPESRKEHPSTSMQRHLAVPPLCIYRAISKAQ